MKIIDVDVKYMLIFILCKMFYVVDICCWYCGSSVTYI